MFATLEQRQTETPCGGDEMPRDTLSFHDSRVGGNIPSSD